MADRQYVRSTLIVAAITGVLLCGVASVYKAGYFGWNIAAIESSSARSAQSDFELTASRVRGILLSEFEGWFDLDDRFISPTYVSGDLNGDGILDLAIAVRLNREVSPDQKTQPPFQFEKPYGLVTPGDAVPPSRLETGALRGYHDQYADFGHRPRVPRLGVNAYHTRAEICVGGRMGQR
jgi:hypothetical protein